MINLGNGFDFDGSIYNEELIVVGKGNDMSGDDKDYERSEEARVDTPIPERPRSVSPMSRSLSPSISEKSLPQTPSDSFKKRSE